MKYREYISVSVDQKASVDILQIVANLPEFLRKPIIRKKLNEFYSLDEPSKFETISMILRGSSSIESNKLYSLIKTWLEILTELESNQVTEIFRVYCEVLLINHICLEKLNIRPLVDAYLKLENKNKKKLSDCLKEVIFLFPNRTEISKAIPQLILEQLKIV
jgi:hypothetical protein